MSEVPVVPPMKALSIEHKAEEFLKRYSPEVLKFPRAVPVDKFYEFVMPELSIPVRTSYTSLRMLGINAEGYTNANQKISIVDTSLADDFSVRGRRRFRSTVAHELGHCILHVPLRRWQSSLQIVGIGLKRERMGLRAFEDPEWQAWRFCYALCMPAGQVEKAVDIYGTTKQGIANIAEVFDMSKSFVYQRLKTLKLIPANAEKPWREKKYASNPR